MCGVHRAHVPKFASVRCRWAGLCSRCSPFILTWSHWFPLCTEVRLLLVYQGSHLSETSPAEREALQPESFLPGLIRLTSGVRFQSPLFWAEWSSCPSFWDLILTPDKTETTPSTHLRLCTSAQRKFLIGRQGEPEVCKAIRAF